MAIINGTESNDTIQGGQGDDTLTGGGAQDTFVIGRGEGIVTITDFGGVGTGLRPAPDVIAEVDTLKFEGAQLSAQNLLLTQDGSDLLLAFEGVEDTQVILKDFQLENLDNLSSSTGASVDIGNILFDGQTQIQDSFGVANADRNRTGVFNLNTVTFLNDLDNTIQGRNDSNDIVNAQGGNDRLQGLSGNDLLRGGFGNDTLIGNGSNSIGDIDTLTGGAGGDTFILSYDDGDPATAGTGDYALITDFNTSEDKIQLTGQQSDYVLEASPSGLPVGTALYSTDELIGIVQGSSGLSLDGGYFSFQ